MASPSTPAQSAPRVAWSAARVAYLVHCAAGLWFTIMLTLVVVSGTLAVFAHEADRLVFPQLGVSPLPEARRVNPGLLYDAVSRAYPGMGVTRIDTKVHEPNAAARTTVLLPNGNRRAVTLDPYTGEVLGEEPPMTVGGFIAPLHAVLFNGLPGFCVVNFFGLVLLVGVVSGLVAYRKFWRGFFKLPRFGRGGRIVLGDLHRLTALWTLGFLLVICLTGTWYFYNFPLVRFGLAPDVVGVQPDTPMLSEADLDALGPGAPRPLSGAAIVDAALAAYPDLTVTGLMPPMNLNMPFVVYGERGEYLHGRDPNAVHVNPFTGAVMGAHLSEDLRLDQFIYEAMSQLHHGELVPPRWGGGALMAMKTVWFLCGVGASFLCVSGVLLFYRRTRRALPQNAWRRAWDWIKPWGGPMSVFKYVNVLLVLGLVAGMARYPQRLAPKPPQTEIVLPAKSAGPFEVSLAVAFGPDTVPVPGARVTVRPRIAHGAFAQARSIRVGLTPPQGAAAAGVRVKGPEKLAAAPLRLPMELGQVELWVEIRRWDGTAHRASWPLAPGKGGLSSS